MVRWAPPLPERFGNLPAGFDLFFGCGSGGCHRGVLVDRIDCIRRWGEEGRIDDIARRLRCETCKRRGAVAELRRKPLRSTQTEGERAHAKLSLADKLAGDIAKLKPTGIVLADGATINVST